MIIPYMGYSPPKCTCHGKQSHSSKYMILLKCPHAQSHVSSPHRFPHTCLSQMREKCSFQNKSFLFSKTYYRVWVKIIGQPSEANLLDNLPEQPLRREFLDNLPTQFSRKSSVEIPFTNIFPFYFLSCHALTPNIIGCPSAYGMHYVNPNNSC